MVVCHLIAKIIWQESVYLSTLFRYKAPVCITGSLNNFSYHSNLRNCVYMPEASVSQKAFVELLGTFILTFIGTGAIISSAAASSTGSSSLLIVAIAHGIALAIAVTIALNISGGHINPAVTIGMLVTKRISAKLASIYIFSQVVGAAIAELAVLAVYPLALLHSTNSGLLSLAPGISALNGIAIEAIITFFLVIAVFGTVVDKRAPPIAGLGIGLMLVIIILAAGPFTGAAANPAVAFGPELATLNFTNWYVYWIGPVIGGVVAALLYSTFVIGRQAKRK